MDDGDAIHINMEETLGVDFDEDDVVEIIKQKLNEVSFQSFDCSICRVPTLMFKENPEAYTPHMVSIGPIHHDQKHLQPMETHKMQYFKKFLHRNCPASLENYVEVMKDLAERAYRCYPEVNIERKSFIMMMVVDGCFILELLHILKECGYLNDEICWAFNALLDLILVENQLPLFVLEELYRVFLGNSAGAADTWTRLQDVICQSLVKWLMTTLFGSVIDQTTNRANNFNRIPPNGKPKHLLAFVREFLIPSLPSESHQQQEEGNNQSTEPMRCATDLKNANVHFEKNKNPTSLLDINFDYAKGVLTIPPIVVQDMTEPILRNLMAYEFYSADYSYITEYIFFLNEVINSGKDVELLQESEIILGMLTRPNEVEKLFYSLIKHTEAETRYTTIINRKVMKYSNRRRKKWKASLMLNYFSTPWSLLSVVAAIILLVLTFTQTIFAVLSYHH